MVKMYRIYHMINYQKLFIVKNVIIISSTRAILQNITGEHKF
jgi:hypothetical protein